MWAKAKMIIGAVLGVCVFVLTLGAYRAGKRSERLDQREADNEAQRKVTQAAAEGNDQFQEKVNEARNTHAGRGRFTQ